LVNEWHYAIHGVTVAVTAADRRAACAVDRRLHGFNSTVPGRPDVGIEYLPPGAELRAPDGVSRPILRTPSGDELSYFPGCDRLFGDLERVRVVCDAPTGRVRVARADHTGRALYVAAHPVTTVCLLELLKRLGRFWVHAACLAQAGRALLVAGPSGAGKSTLALALALAPGGPALLSDDATLLVAANGGVQALGFSDLIGVTADTAARFPALVAPGAAPAHGFPKHLVPAGALGPAPGGAPAATPVALVFPRIAGGGASRLLDLSRRDALVELVRDVLLTEPVTTQGHIDALGALVAQVSCHRLEMGSDLGPARELVGGLITG
jgi:hypothetical protein